MIRFCSLGSGSGGNALLVESGRTRVLVDCGFSMQETERRLARAGVLPADLDALLITHEHADHIGAAGPFSRRYRLPVHLSHGTRTNARDPNFAALVELQPDQPITIGDLEITPFTVPHDAREPTQFVFGDGATRLVLMTDAGHVTPHMIRQADAANALLLECNHDPQMLRTGRYPEPLKQRVGGGYGHLPNHQATTLLQQADCSRLSHLIGMHLSSDNNHPDLARAALAAGVGATANDPEIATQDHGFGWREIR
ncbi:MAG: MBL fold metallo-hydrolase [Pseudomonadota bacterium]